MLLWKSLLLVFGDSKQLSDAKRTLRHDTELDKDKGETQLTASPLDYHVFRQEITSKYPAYNPPPPLIPLEINNNSILPPLPSNLSRVTSQDNLQGLGNANGIGKSIFHQPVHISTPAPSPPPSPGAAGGKGGKKQNYQTNQNFPFLYPPLDSSSNDLGGKGNAEIQDKLVGKKWQGSDIPASILEAAQLFASRMRMSRSLRQLWNVREDFVRFERGWEGGKKTEGDDDHTYGLDEELMELALNQASVDSDEPDNLAGEDSPIHSSSATRPETDDEQVQGRLDAIELYYVGSTNLSDNLS